MLSGKYCFSEYINSRKFSTTIRCNYSSESAIKFDDYFRRIAASEKLPLNGERLRELFADKYVNAACRIHSANDAYKNFVLACYVDDCLLIAPTKQTCSEAESHLISLLKRLGFGVKRFKVPAPRIECSFLVCA